MLRLFFALSLLSLVAAPGLASGSDAGSDPRGTSVRASSTPPPARPPPIPEEILRTRPPAPPADRPDEGLLREQLEQLDSFLQLPPEKLQRMRQTIEMIERMNEEERAVLRMQIRQFTEVSSEIRAEIRKVSESLPPRYHTLFNQYWLSLYPDQRSQLRDEMSALSSAEREAFLVARLDRFRARMDAMLTEMKSRAESQKPSAD